MQDVAPAKVTALELETFVVHVAEPAATLIVSPAVAFVRQVWTLAEAGEVLQVGDDPVQPTAVPGSKGSVASRLKRTCEYHQWNPLAKAFPELAPKAIRPPPNGVVPVAAHERLDCNTSDEL